MMMIIVTITPQLKSMIIRKMSRLRKSQYIQTRDDYTIFMQNEASLYVLIMDELQGRLLSIKIKQSIKICIL